MPRIKSTRTESRIAESEALVALLEKELRGERQQDGPVILEVTVGNTDYLQIIVVWDRWTKLPADIRTQLVVEAYRRVTDQAQVEKISTIIPCTTSQALDMGLLPYHVQCSVPNDDPRRPQIDVMLKEQGAIATSAGIELRLPTRELAETAIQKLKSETKEMQPPILWQVSEQVGRIVDFE